MRTLVVNANWLGDVLFSTAALRALHKHAPGDTLACLVPARCEALLRHNPYLNEVIVADDRDSLRSLPSAWTLWRSLKEKKFDRAIFFHRSRSKKMLAFLAGIPERSGFGPSKGKNILLTHVFAPPSEGTHRTDYYLELLRVQGVAPAGRTPDFFPADSAADELKRLFAATGLDPSAPYAAVHPGGNWDLKRWPAKHFISFARFFLEAHPEFSLVVCGTAPEAEVAEEIRHGAASPRAVSFCGKTTLDTLAHLLKGARFLLSNDSGPIHLAASQKTPIAGLFGPTSAEITGPVSDGPVLILKKDVGCQVPCYFRACDDHVCMEWLSPCEVFTAIEAWLHEAVC